jgi:hypothetical protein
MLSYVWYGSVGNLRSQLASSRTHDINQDQNRGAADVSPRKRLTSKTYILVKIARGFICHAREHIIRTEVRVRIHFTLAFPNSRPHFGFMSDSNELQIICF